MSFNFPQWAGRATIATEYIGMAFAQAFALIAEALEAGVRRGEKFFRAGVVVASRVGH